MALRRSRCDDSILEQETGPSRRSASHFLLLEVATVCRASPPVKYTKLLKLLHLDPENPARCAGGAWWSGAADKIKTARNGVAGRNGALGKCCGCKPLLHQKFQVPNQKWRYGTKPHYRAISGFRFPLHKPDPYSFRYQISGFATCHPQHHKSPRRLSSFSAPFRERYPPTKQTNIAKPVHLHPISFLHSRWRFFLLVFRDVGEGHIANLQRNFRSNHPGSHIYRFITHINQPFMFVQWESYWVVCTGQ